jgi:pimeloyl-ACP methyl ester carboxylesterase
MRQQPLSFQLLLVFLAAAAFHYITAFAFISDLPPSRNSESSRLQQKQQEIVSTITGRPATASPSSAGNSIPSQQASFPSIQYIAGRRCLFAPCRDPSSREANCPLVVIGGTAQTISSWEHQVPGLSKDRDVLIYECLGQGPVPVDGCATHDFSNVTLPYQAEVLASVVDAAYDSGLFQERLVDVAGFSLGGRIALATASIYPHMFRRLHITGVGAARDDYAKVILESWKDILMQGRPPDAEGGDDGETALRAFGWSTILATYSREFVAAMGAKKMRTWVDGIANQNTMEGISALLEQTHGEVEIDEWSPLLMARRISQSQGNIAGSNRLRGKLVVGGNDQMATPAEVERLGKELGWEVLILTTSAGHAVPMECAREWRADLLNFLSGDS